MILVYFQGKLFDITVIQVCAPTSSAKDAEVQRFYGDLQAQQLQHVGLLALGHVGF